MEIPFEIKNMNEEKGTFVAYGSTFGNEDLGGDVVVKGAFTKSLKDNPASSVYMFYNHDTKEIIGEYTSIEEDERGLLIKGRLFIDDIQRARETHFLMMKGLIKKFSIGFKTIKRGFEQGKRMLKELQLIEVSPVTFPMNTEADLLGVKSMNGIEFKNAALVSMLNAGITKLVDVGGVRSEIIARMATSAGIASGTVNQILNNDISMPPAQRLRGFAKVLKLSFDDLLDATGGSEEDDKKGIDDIESLSEVEDLLKNNGFSNKESTALVSKVKKISNGGEPHKKSDVGDPQSTEQKELEEARIKKDNQEKSDFGGLLDKLINENKG